MPVPSTVKYYHNIDLVTNQLLNARLQSVTTAERITIGETLNTLSVGFIIFDTDTERLYSWNGTEWILISGADIYLNDGTLSSNRIMTLGGYSFTVAGGSSSFIVKPDGSVRLTSLAGANPRMVVANANGDLTTEPIVNTSRFVETFTATASQTTFNTGNVLIDNLFDVYVNGVRLDTSSFTYTAYQIVLNDPCYVDDIVNVVSIQAVDFVASVPSQAGQAGKILTTDGTNLVWSTIQTSVTSSLLKADSSGNIIAAVAGVDYQIPISLSGFVPTSLGITINGVTQDLVADRTWNIFNLYYQSLDTGTVNVDTVTTTVLRNENGLGAALPYAPVLHVASSDTMWQLQGTYGTSGNGTLYFRQGYSGSWGTWLTILSTANYTTYAVPKTRTLTINGTAYDLSADRSWSIVAGVSSFNTRTGAITLTSSDVTTALGFTPYNSTNPSGYITSAKDWFGAVGTSGTLNWNDVTNTRPGTGYTLLYGNATNGFGVANYYHAFNLEYSSKDGTGNVTQLAIAYGTPGNDIRMRGRYSGTWTSWVTFLNTDNYTTYAVPKTRTLTINGTTYDLSADRSWSIAGGVTSFNTRTGAVTLTSADVTTALGYTPYNSTNPNSYISGITSSMVTTALGYTPYSASNPSGYISSISSGNVTTALGYTPVSELRQLSINGVTYDLSAPRSWSVGTVTSIATSGPITGGTITGSGTISITQATTSTNGYLSSTDWNTFNNKYNLPSLTSGSILFSNGTTIAQDNANLFWNNSSKYLGIGRTPSYHLDVAGNARISGGAIYFDSSSDALFSFQYAGVSKWRIGNAYIGGLNYFQLYDSVNNLERIRWNNDSTATFTSNFTFIGASNAVATFQAAQPDVAIQSLGGSNPVSLSFVPSSGYEGVIQNNVSGGFIQIKTANTVRVTFKNGGQVNFQPLASDPSGAGAGDVYYNSGTNKLRLYNGSAWVDLN